MTVGTNLRRIRLALGDSQEAFGSRVGWHRTFVGAVERGERNLTLRTIERLAEQIHVLPLDLLQAHPATATTSGRGSTSRPGPRAGGEAR